MTYITVISKIITYNIKCGTVKRFIYNSLSLFRQFVETSLLSYITSINIILIIISNCSLLNPGPTDNSNTGDDNTIKVFYQNVHGLITFGSLGDKDPVLNITKILELKSYVHYHQRDIIVLNETWLKSCINDSEIFHNNGYKVFKRERKPDSHPLDPSNSNKFKSNGGGILIAVSNSLHMSPKVMKSDSKAEILSITLQLKNSKKICITTCYRVGTLGEQNLVEISKHLQLVSSNKSIINHTVFGDMNLDSIDWIQNSSNTVMHREFLNTFGNNNLSQLVTIPIHYLGNTLDILLSDKPSTISNIAVKDHNEIVKSDHFAITFDMKFTNLISRNRGMKRIIRNYKKANWIAISNEIN